ncbi:MAG TPA: ATP-binding cassette domain-containing protein, partial [Patescibacteria group bacterium]|nr:ATP-binding cassette domain-containing protein [Patescibacteria group bacterium]
ENMGNIITVKKLVKNFNGVKAVDDISFDVKKSEIFAFLGPNGAGKSTTIKMLTTLLSPTSGDISVDGQNPQNFQDVVRKSFGIVFQDPSLDDDLTALENMELHAALYAVPKAVRTKRIEDLVTFVDLWDRRNSLVKTFSGGMKRRLEIARGLVHHPKILFLDEPTIGLDPQTRNHMWTYLKDVNKKEGMTVFFTTHYMDEAEKNADRIVIIDHGKIIASGTPGELKKKTDSKTLEDAFLSLTGHAIRNEEAGAVDTLRQHRRAWGGKR